ACDEHDMPRLTGLFTEQAQFDAGNGLMVATGRDAITDMFVELFKIRGPAFHWTHDVVAKVDPQNPSQATGRVYSHAETTPNATVSLAAMRYDDRYERVEGRWLFSYRKIDFLYYVPATEYNTGLSRKQRVWMSGQWADADYPEALESWQAFAREHLK
ncbi:MAG: nuclear transport factor 2 family protein, partial [Pseudomonadales bacterium]